jgi:hypothetical protein
MLLSVLLVSGIFLKSNHLSVSQTGTKKSKRQKPRKKKKDIRRVRSLSNYSSLGHELTFCDCGQMRASGSSTVPSWRDRTLERAADLAMPANLHSSAAAVPGQELHRNEDNQIGALSMLTKNDGSGTLEASATEPRSRASSPTPPSSPQARPPPPLIALPSAISTPVKHQPPLFISGDDATHMINLRPSSRSGGSETRSQSDEGKPLLSVSGADCIANASGEGVNRSEGEKCDRNAPTTAGRNGENELRTHTDTVGLTGLDATPVIAAEGMTARVSDESRLPSELLHPATHTPGFPYGLDTEAGQVGMQGDFSVPIVDRNEDKSGPSFGVLSNTTFDPSLAYQPHSYSHGPDIEQDDFIVEDIETEFVADSAMEDTGMEWKAEASVTTETPQPFSWIPTSVSGAFHTIFPDVRSTAFISTATRVLEPRMLSEPYAMGTEIPEGASVSQVAPLPDIPCHFVSAGTHLSSVESELFKRPEYIVPNLPTIPASYISASQTTSRSSFPSASPPISRAGPIPVSPSTRGHIETHDEGVMDLDEEMGPKLGVAASIQHETPSLRCVLILGSIQALTELTHYRYSNMNKATGLDARLS